MFWDVTDESDFRFHVGFDAFEKSGAGDNTERRIAGFVTTDDLDQQGENILQEGLDFAPFLANGWFNDNHAKGTAGIVGHPSSAQLMSKGGQRGWYVEGHLLKGHKPADDIWTLANALQKSDRRLGFSVEGKIQKRIGRDRKTIARAVVKNVAITNCPVNDRTSLQVLAKSLDAMNKALSVGPANPDGPAGAPVTVGSGAPLMPESLDGAPRAQSYGKRKKRKLDVAALSTRAAEGGLTKSEAVACLRRHHPHVSQLQAETAWSLARQWKRAAQ